MQLLETENPLHELARFGSKEQWSQLLATMNEEGEGLFAVRFHLNRRDELRYTPLHTAIFARYVHHS